MSVRSLLLGASALALAAIPGVALAGAPIAPHIASVTISPVTVVNLAQLAKSAANARALSMPVPYAALRHKYPTADGRPRAARLLPTMAPNTTITRAAGSFTGFNGTYDGQLPAVLNYELEPPDQGLAVARNTIVEDVNNVLEIFQATGKPLVGPVSDYALFGLTENNAPVLSDPHVEFDPDSQRWFIEEVVELSDGFNGFALAVSQTSNPAGAYYVYLIDDQGANISGCQGSCLADYPQPGYDKNAFYITADLFSNVTGNYVNAGLYALPKAALISGQSFTYDYYVVPEFVLEPSIPARPNDFSTKNNGTEFFETAQEIYYGTNTLGIYALTDTASVGSTTPPPLFSTTVTPEPYAQTVPATEPNDVGPYGQSQGATTSPQLDGGYNAVSGGVKFYNHGLFAALATGSTDKNGLPVDDIAWFKVAVSADSTGVHAQMGVQGYIVPPTGYSLLYPAIAAGIGGRGAIGFTIVGKNASHPGAYPSTGYVLFKAGHHHGGPITITGQGSASDDGFTGYPGAGPAGVGRWGDFASATEDPVTGYLYLGNEYIPDASLYPRGSYANWGTYISVIK